MSSTITETERRTVPKISQSEISTENTLKKRETFTRTTSIEKLRKFNSFICSQHYYIIPSLLLWLKTSQTILTSNMEKCMLYVKSMFLISTIQKCLYEKTKDNTYAALFKLTTKDVVSIINVLLIRTNELLVSLYEEIKRLILVSAIYLGVTVIVGQFLGLICLLFFKIPPVGFVFLIGCVLYLTRIAVLILYKTKEKEVTNDNVKTVEEKKKIRKRLAFIGKTISNVKLF